MKKNKKSDIEKKDSLEVVEKEPKNEEKKGIKYNKKLLYIIPSFVVFIIVLLIVISKTNVVPNILGIDSDKTVVISSVTYQGKNKYQIDSTSKFIVETKNIKSDELNKYLAIEPAYNYTIENKGKNKFEITIDNIEANQVVNIDFVNNEKIDKKWAFQSSNEYKISSTYPADKSNKVSVNTGIDITFTHPGTSLEEFKNHFTIEPKVEGDFSIYGRTITFIPKTSLKNATNYVITIKKGLKLDDSEIKQDYSFSFTTVGKNNINTSRALNDSITNDNISTFKANELPKIAIIENYDLDYDEDAEDITYKTIKKVVVEKFSSADDFEKYIKGTTTIKRKDLGEYKFHKYNESTIEFNKQLGVGYYLFNVYTSSNQLLFSVPVQINNLSAYLMNSERDLIVWVANNGKFEKDIEVVYGDKNTKTNENGIAIINNISNGSLDIKYVKINNGSNNPIFVGITNYSLNNYPFGYIYSDRPIYKNTDEVKIWGYVPLEFFADKVDTNKFSIVFNEKNIPVKVSDDGSFETKIDLKNIASDYYDIILNYNNTPIAYRGVTVENYQLQNYIYEISTDKEYVEAGKNIRVNIKVKHVSNLPASNKDINIMFNDKTYKGKTNQSGEVTFNLTTDKIEENYDTNVDYQSIEILGTAQDSEDWNLTYDIYVIYNKVAFGESKYNEKTKEFTTSLYNLDLTKSLNPELAVIESLRGSNYKGKVKIILKEEKNIKKSEKEYDEYTKQNKTSYYWDTDYEKNVIEKDVEVVDGKLSYKVDYDFKKSTDDTYYSYTIDVIAKDSNGHQNKISEWIYSNYFDLDEKTTGPNEVEAIAEGDNSYDLYEYQMASLNEDYNDWYFKGYSVGEKINIKLFDKTNNPINNDNKVLQIKYREKILSTKIKSANNIISSYEKIDIPGVELTGAYYDGKNFYRMPSNYYKYKEEDSKININITPNKKEYSPRDEVEVKIKTVDKDGKAIKSNINISVVNEAIFNLQPDDTSILSQIYSYRYFDSYTFSTYRNYALYSNIGGAGNEAGGGRYEFGDTIHFESLKTDSNGEATVKFKLNDSVTSFRITVHASTKEGSVGAANTKISSTLPLAIESNAPVFVKSSDDLVINTTSVAPKNKSDKVKYTVEIKELNKKQEKEGLPGQIVYANFGKLKVGKYSVKISAVSGKLKDEVEYPVEIIETANEIKILEEKNIKSVERIKPTKNPIYVEIYPEYLSKYLKYLDKLNNYTERLDTKIAYYKALEYEKDFYNNDNIITVEDFSKYKTSNGLRALVNGEKDEVLTALSLYYTNYFDISSKSYYDEIGKEDEDYSRIKALLVLAAKREPVLLDLNNYEANETEEYIYKALAYIFLGDYEQAKDIYNEHLTSISEENLESLVAVIETFVNRDKAAEDINKILDNKESDDYINFAIISYFENNQDELLTNEKVTVTHGDKKEELEINKYNINSLVLYDDDLNDIKFESKSDKINVAYYYVGRLSETQPTNINISVSGNKNIGNTMYLNIDYSKVGKGVKNIYVYLPANVILSPKSSDIKNVGVYKTHENKVLVSLNRNSPTKISIPLIVKLPGKYTFESVIMEDNGKYNISNEVSFETK